MASLCLSLRQVRRAALGAQLLDGRTRLKRGLAGAAQAVEHLGYVQLDTIAVVERAHHHILWARVPGYAPPLLDELLQQRRVFEYWGHAASVLPLADYRYYLPLMRRHREQPDAWAQGMLQGQHGVAAEVLRRIRTDGPVKAAELDSPREGSGAWWGWKPAKAALELLFWQGELMISARQGFQRVYDLTERVLPPGTDTREPDAAELGCFCVRRALTGLGVARERDIARYLHIAKAEVVGEALRELLAAGEVAQVQVAGQDKPYYALAAGLAELARLRAVKPRLHVLSPFDGLVIHRDRLQRLFDYDYTIECYTPAPKRKYGYFSLPLAWGETLAGRLDAKAERKAGVLSVRGLWLEPACAPDAAFYAALGAKLRAFAAFNGCADVRIEAAVARAIAKPLREHSQVT